MTSTSLAGAIINRCCARLQHGAVDPQLPTDFPGLVEHHGNTDTARCCKLLEEEFADDIKDRRFIPYLLRHEFEAPVLASLSSLRDDFDAEDALSGLSELERAIAGFPPEDINDGPSTAPSKRLMSHVPGYSKHLHGPFAIEDSGLVEVRGQCPRFDRWVRTLEGLDR